MKKKNVVTLLALFAMAGGLVACGDKTSENPTDTPKPTETVKPTEPEPEEKFDNLAPDLSNDPIPAPTKDAEEEETLGEGAETRSYQSASDLMINDFSAPAADSAFAGGATQLKAPYLHVRVNTSNDVAPISEDASIYKAATGAYDIDKGYSIGFRMRLADSKTIDNNHLVLALRGSDDYKTFPIAFSKAKDPDGEALPTLTGEYQDFVISPMATLENENTPYSTKDGGYSSLKVLDEILGFHLYAAGNADCTIDIESVFLRKEGAEDVILDNFEHAKPNDGDPNLWWRDSTGEIIQRHAIINNGGTFTQSYEADQLLSNVVLDIKGDTTGTSVSFIEGENVTTKSWADLKDSQGNAVVSALKNTYSPLVINLANSGFAGTPTSIRISSTTEVDVDKIFFSDLIDRVAEEYPVIDVRNRKVFDDFNRNQTGINGDYEASNTSEVVKNAGLDYVLSYNNGDKITIDGSKAVIDATSLASDSYVNLKIGSDKHARTNEDYLVFSVKLEEGATMDNFRFVDNGTAYYANDWKAAYGVKSLDTPYTGENGFSLYVLDLVEMGANVTNTMDLYYSGTGKVMIDEIFFADDYYDLEQVGETTEVNQKYENLSGYAGGSGFNTDAPIVGITLKGDGEKATLETIRFAYAGDVHWIKDHQIFDQYGHEIDAKHVISGEGETFYISIEDSGWDYDGTAKEFYAHFGLDGAEGTIEFVSLAGYSAKSTEYNLGIENKETAANGYSYVGWLGAKHTSDDLVYLKLKVKGDGKATLENLRIGNGQGEYWYNVNGNADRHQLLLADGTVPKANHVIAKEGETILIDLTASKAELNGEAHLHYSDEVGGVLTFESVTLLAYRPNYSAVYETIYHA